MQAYGERPGEVFGCIPHGARAYRERDFFAMGSDPIVFDEALALGWMIERMGGNARRRIGG